jgi:hypothetical protein
MIFRCSRWWFTGLRADGPPIRLWGYSIRCRPVAMPYAPYKRGPLAMAAASLVAAVALAMGIIMMDHHKDGRGVVFIAAAVAAAVLSVLARPR